MNVYSISCNFNNPDQKHKRLTKLIDAEFEINLKVLESYWLVYTDLTPEQIFNSLKPILSYNDKFFIVAIKKPYSGQLTQSCSDWLSKYLI
jgi:hypothetical protein